MKDIEIPLPKPAEIVTLPSYMDCHDHDYAQVVIGLNGKAEFDVSGVGNYIGPGQGCVVTAGLDHAFGGVVGRSDILVLNLHSRLDIHASFLERINELSRSDIYFQLDSQIRQLIHMLVLEMQASPEDQILSRACNDTVMALICRHTSGLQLSVMPQRLDMDVIDQYIESHLSRKISVTQLAGSVFLGESQFHLLFKQQTGMTPHQYVLNKRVDLAKSLIEQGAFNLAHIAELSGFSNQSAFTHTFSRLTGLSPSQYKKQFS
ncbi:AraC family transcriptional regulator [Vibrio hannami]|uniref:AraC family transcriptional regulator n=1 Tax=Vibrio hannami TaxID=2717094 RepID=UPI00240F82D8|nr:AraC family transcriptional regulator [Vibrio hannami]MDG3086293.1 AraC family transcriptional regulator [Vibrio hannami]